MHPQLTINLLEELVKMIYRKATSIVFVFFGMLSCIHAQAQNLKDDMEKMVQYYSKLQDMNMVSKVSYSSGANKKYALVSQCVLVKKGNSFLYSTDDSEVLISESSSVMIQKKDKRIIYKLNTKEEYLKATKNMQLGGVDSIMAMNDSLTYVGTSNGIKRYRLRNSRRAIFEVEVLLDSANYSLQSLVYHYRMKDGSTPVAKIQFTYPTVGGAAADQLLESKYIIRKDKLVKLTSAYTSYELVIVEE